MFTYGVPSLRPKRNPTPVSNICEAEPFRTQRITANAFRSSLTDKWTTRFLTGQSWRALKCWYLGGGSERGFWRYFADVLNQGPVVQTFDSAIHRINHYPADKY